MDTFLCIFSDHVWLPILEFLIVAVLVRAILYDVPAHLRAKAGGTGASIRRGEKSWGILLSFWAVSIVIVEIIVSSDSIADHKVIMGLMNVGALIYLNLFSSYFKNRIIGWSSKVQNRQDPV